MGQGAFLDVLVAIATALGALIPVLISVWRPSRHKVLEAARHLETSFHYRGAQTGSLEYEIAQELRLRAAGDLAAARAPWGAARFSVIYGFIAIFCNLALHFLVKEVGIVLLLASCSVLGVQAVMGAIDLFRVNRAARDYKMSLMSGVADPIHFESSLELITMKWPRELWERFDAWVHRSR